MKDSIYKLPMSAIPTFYFGSEVANVFDDMISRSVPFYSEILNQCASFSRLFYKENTNIYDLGCSTGSLLTFLLKQFNGTFFSYIGIDNSKDMLIKAREKFSKLPSVSIQFIEEDITRVKLEKASIVVSSYLMQFIVPQLRKQTLQNIYNELEEGGIFLLSEKITSINSEFIDLHHQFKKEMGYSQLEIDQKRESLKGFLIPFSIPEYIQLLTEIGFKQVEPFFQWYNFASLVAKK